MERGWRGGGEGGGGEIVPFACNEIQCLIHQGVQIFHLQKNGNEGERQPTISESWQSE